MAAVGHPRTSEARWEEIHALLVLDGLAGSGRSRVRAAVEAFGSAARAVRSGRRRLGSAMGAAVNHVRITEMRRRAEDALTRARSVGMDVIAWGDDVYPDRLFQLHDPPPVLFAHGRLELLTTRCVTIVGARRATESGREIAARLAGSLARRDLTVVSGLALGIDGAAHGGALEADGATVAVLGTGVDVIYPRAHARLYRAIREHGLVLSEFVPGTPALPYHFPKRNRILAALGQHVVVVEAGEKSGSLITVDHALDLGREVWAVPGRIDHPATAGSNLLLGDGARPLVSSAAFLDAVAPTRRNPTEAAARREPLLDQLRNGPRSPEELAVALDSTVAEVMVRLTRLELEGAVRRLAGQRFGTAA